jgi:hypothetical protein
MKAGSGLRINFEGKKEDNDEKDQEDGEPLLTDGACLRAGGRLSDDTGTSHRVRFGQLHPNIHQLLQRGRLGHLSNW